MPKSRGRKHAKPTRQKRPAGSYHAQLLRASRFLLDPGTARVEAEHFASGLVGTVWAGRQLGDSSILDAWLDDLTGYAATRRTPEAAGLLAALALLTEHEGVQTALTEWGTPYLVDVPWADTRPPLPLRASRCSDVWDDVATWFLEYDDVVLNVITRRWDFGCVGTIGVFPPAVLDQWDQEVPRSGGELLPRVEVPVAEAVAELLAAQQRTEMTYPPNDDEDYITLGHLLAARVAAVGVTPAREPVHEPLSDADKDALVADFFADLKLELADDEAAREVIDACLWYGESYLLGGPLAWSPPVVETFLLDWLPRKTFFEPEVQRLAPTVTYAWTGWAMTRAGVPKRWAGEAAQVALDLAEEFLALYDGAELSPATELARRISEAGIDPHDKDAVDQLISAYNAEQLARRAADL
jgi:hypothetical protein